MHKGIAFVSFKEREVYEEVLSRDKYEIKPEVFIVVDKAAGKEPRKGKGKAAWSDWGKGDWGGKYMGKWGGGKGGKWDGWGGADAWAGKAAWEGSPEAWDWSAWGKTAAAKGGWGPY